MQYCFDNKNDALVILWTLRKSLYDWTIWSLVSWLRKYVKKLNLSSFHLTIIIQKI